MSGKTAGSQAEPPPGADASAAPGVPLDFETALAQLEELVAKMEDGLALDDSLAAYKKGVELVRICQKRLDAAEQQVKVLQGSLLLPLDGGDEPAGN